MRCVIGRCHLWAGGSPFTITIVEALRKENQSNVTALTSGGRAYASAVGYLLHCHD